MWWFAIEKPKVSVPAKSYWGGLLVLQLFTSLKNQTLMKRAKLKMSVEQL